MFFVKFATPHVRTSIVEYFADYFGLGFQEAGSGLLWHSKSYECY